MVTPAVASATTQINFLEQLSLPARYERLSEKVGPEVASILVPPDQPVQEALAKIVDAIRSQDEGVFVPLYGTTGAGKTTFAFNVSQWQPSALSPSVEYTGPIEFDRISAAIVSARADLPANDRRTTPLVLDHRESAPPTSEEMATIKRLLRSPPGNAPVLVLWPETDEKTAVSMATRYIDIAGSQPIPLPLRIKGPDRRTWAEIAKNTLKLTNKMQSLELIGVDPDDYDVGQYPSLGEFLRKISADFRNNLFELRKSVTKRIELLVLFVSESSEPGVLNAFTNPTYYGLVDTHGLISATPQSVSGKAWSGKMGLLTRCIVQLQARALVLGPVALISAMRNTAPDDHPIVGSLGVKRYGIARAVRDLSRSDIGKILLGQAISRHEARGTPATESLDAFRALATAGLTSGKDKEYNKILSESYSEFIKHHKIPHVSVNSEKILPFCPIIPDTWIEFDDHILCVEYVWRSGDFLSSRRSEAAQYILKKLENYAVALKWTTN